MSIDSKNISVVVQGAVDTNLTPVCLASVRTFLPQAEIILSTWEGSKTDGLDYDTLILSKDPGGVICDPTYKIMNNVNRQIVSSKCGLEAASRQFALKIRSDMKLSGLQFISAWGLYDDKRSDTCRIFKNRIVINNLYCADPAHTNFLFHVSDWVQFGLREDVLNLWDIPLQSAHDMGSYWENKKRPYLDPVPTWLFRYIPEQYIWTECLRKNGESFDFKYHTDISTESWTLSELSFANNVVILDYKNSGFQFLKYDPYKWDYSVQYKHASWVLLYKKYCDPTFAIPVRYVWHNILSSPSVVTDKKRIRRHLYLFFDPILRYFKRIFRWIRRPLLALVYTIKVILRIAVLIVGEVKIHRNTQGEKHV